MKTTMSFNRFAVVRRALVAFAAVGLLAGTALPALAGGDQFSDHDLDGLTDFAEITLHGTDPYNADSDFDGLGDGLEFNLPSNPLYHDTDGDGVNDGIEFQFGTDLLNPLSFPVLAG